jgi:argininosuccinate lyase
LPSAYDKDLQEDKPPVFDAADTLDLVLAVMAGAIATISVHGERMRAAIDPQVLASDVADYLVEKGLPFREAHGIVGQAVRRAQELRSNLSDLPLETWRSLHPAFDVDVRAVFDIERSISRRAACGGTAPEAVREQLRAARQAMDTP